MSAPYIDKNILIKKIGYFVSKHKGIFKDNESRMSDYFEMSVYNDIVRSYSELGYKIKIKNLKAGGIFKYKLSPSGLAENFSYFIISKGKISYEVHHNISTTSYHDDGINYSPDISVTFHNGVSTQMINGKRRSFIENSKLVTLFEVKNLTPFPEVLFNFMGLVNEMTPEFFAKEYFVSNEKKHIAPSLIFSGRLNNHTFKIKKSLENRYHINIIAGLFNEFSISTLTPDLNFFTERK